VAQAPLDARAADHPVLGPRRGQAGAKRAIFDERKFPTASEVIRKHCRNCAASLSGVVECDDFQCALYLFRNKAPGVRGSRLRAIRTHCRDCSGGRPSEISRCAATNCHLWPYRFGVRPVTAIKRGLLDV